jgi:shikimate kinase
MLFEIEMDSKIIYLLIGQKGSGKSFIGSLIEKEFGIKFVRVEDWVKLVKKCRSVEDETYLKQAFEVIENGIRECLKDIDKLVFESTGLTTYFDQMLQSLERDYNVTTIGIKANSEICLERVRKRDQTIHINISDGQVSMINKKVILKDLQTDYQINNEMKTERDIIKELKKIKGLTEKSDFE